MLELWLVRHGETLWNHEGRVQGQSDPPLSARGRVQAEKLASRLEHVPFAVVYSSDLQRATETARLALPGAHVESDTHLRELHFGAWEGKLWSEVEDTDAAALNAWLADPYCNTPTGGEAYTALSERVQTWLTGLPNTGRVVAVTHGGPIRAVLYSLTGPPDGHRWRFDTAPASLTQLVLGDQGAIIKTVGDVAHLELYPESAQLEHSQDKNA